VTADRLWLVPATTINRQKIAFVDVVPDNNDRVQDLVNRANKTVERRRIVGTNISLSNHNNNILTYIAPVRETSEAIIMYYILYVLFHTENYLKTPLLGHFPFSV